MKTYDTYIDKWTHNDTYYYTTMHRSTKIWYGPCPECGQRTTDYGGSIVCVDLYCKHTSNRPYVNPIKPEPNWWNTNINVQKDGNLWCAFFDGFINLQESKTSFGETPEIAVTNLRLSK